MAPNADECSGECPLPVPTSDRPRGTVASELAAALRSDPAERRCALAAPLSAEDCQVQSMPDASPTKWHLAHITWFFETFMLERYEPGFRAVRPGFRVLFNSYYQGVGEQHPRPQRGLITRPTLDEVQALPRRGRRAHGSAARKPQPTTPALAELVDAGPAPRAAAPGAAADRHQARAVVQPDARAGYAKRWPMTRGAAAAAALVRLRRRAVRARPRRRHATARSASTTRRRATRSLAPFELASRPVTYGEYLAFIDDGGYRRPELWLSMGWDWVQAAQRDAPLYWQRDATAAGSATRCKAWSRSIRTRRCAT